MAVDGGSVALLLSLSESSQIWSPKFEFCAFDQIATCGRSVDFPMGRPPIGAPAMELQMLGRPLPLSAAVETASGGLRALTPVPVLLLRCSVSGATPAAELSFVRSQSFPAVDTVPLEACRCGSSSIVDRLRAGAAVAPATAAPSSTLRLSGLNDEGISLVSWLLGWK